MKQKRNRAVDLQRRAQALWIRLWRCAIHNEHMADEVTGDENMCYTGKCVHCGKSVLWLKDAGTRWFHLRPNAKLTDAGLETPGLA